MFSGTCCLRCPSLAPSTLVLCPPAIGSECTVALAGYRQASALAMILQICWRDIDLALSETTQHTVHSCYVSGCLVSRSFLYPLNHPLPLSKLSARLPEADNCKLALHTAFFQQFVRLGAQFQCHLVPRRYMLGLGFGRFWLRGLP